jgi:hypothetical protein
MAKYHVLLAIHMLWHIYPIKATKRRKATKMGDGAKSLSICRVAYIGSDNTPNHNPLCGMRRNEEDEQCQLKMSFNTWKDDLIYQEEFGHTQDDPDWAVKYPSQANKSLWRNFRRIKTLSERDQMTVFAVVNFYVDKYDTPNRRKKS